jgi:glycosyltransferase involved in cell wall biosynthesis
MKLAIIIPVYNAAKTVGETLASLQAIEDGWEHVDKVVLCDDASSDQSAEIIQKFPFTRCRLELLSHEKNRGEAQAYATLVQSLSQDTDWFLILHADDLALSNFITRNVEIIGMCDSKVATVSSNFYNFDSSSEWLAAKERDVVLFRDGTEENIRHTALVGCWWHISGALVNKRLWNDFGGWQIDLPLVGDWDLVLRWQKAGYTVAHSVIATTKYRCWNSNSLSLGSYAPCADLLGRVKVALGLPDIFRGKVRFIFAWGIFHRAFRRAMKFLLQFRFKLALNALWVGFSSFGRLMFQ